MVRVAAFIFPEIYSFRENMAGDRFFWRLQMPGRETNLSPTSMVQCSLKQRPTAGRRPGRRLGMPRAVRRVDFLANRTRGGRQWRHHTRSAIEAKV